MPLPADWSSHLNSVEEWLAARVQAAEGGPDRLREAMAYSLLAGGKRLRPVVCRLACVACGGDPDSALPAAAAVEMVHTYSLIHDDLPAMDDDDLRRGRPTNHIAYDQATAILAGDALLTLAFEVLASELSDPLVAAACCADLAKNAGWCGMVGGQMADLAAEGRFDAETLPESDSDRLEHLKSIHARKTGCLISCALTMGARVADASQTQLAQLEKYGRAVGLAFQIADDLLDITGDEQTMGKGVRKDAQLGKLTYPGLLGVDNSRLMATQLIDDAIASLHDFGSEADPLRELARFVIDRDH